MMKREFDTAVIGGGGAGIMAYLRSVLNADHTAFFLGDARSKKKGRATWVADVDNIPGMHGTKRPIISSVTQTLKWIDSQKNLKEFGRTFPVSVKELRGKEGFFEIFFGKDPMEMIRAKYVIIATGVMDIQPEIDGSIQPILPFANRGDILYCVRCDGHRTIGHDLSIIGFGDTAVYIAGMMKERYGHEKIPILLNGSDSEFSEKAKEVIELHSLEIHPEPIVEVLGDPKKEGLEAYRLEGGKKVETNSTIVSLGIMAYNDLLKQVEADLDSKGKAIAEPTGETSIPGVFVAGDLVSGKKMQIYTGWDEAVDAADEVNRKLRAEKRSKLRSA